MLSSGPQPSLFLSLAHIRTAYDASAHRNNKTERVVRLGAVLPVPAPTMVESAIPYAGEQV